MFVKCKICGKEFRTIPSRIKEGRGKYCSPKCYYKSIGETVYCKCKVCGKIFIIPLSAKERGRGKYCSKKCCYTINGEKHPLYNKVFTAEHCRKISINKIGNNSGAKHPRWKNGRIEGGRYIFILVPKHHSTPKTGYVLEHRIIAEKFIGRNITQQEEVHHINGNKHDNTPSNLYLFKTKSDHMKFHAHPFELKSNIL